MTIFRTHSAVVLAMAQACTQKEKDPDPPDRVSLLPSDVLLSQDPAVQVPSALRSLTSVFGMGTGVTSATLPLDRDVFPENRMRM